MSEFCSKAVTNRIEWSTCRHKIIVTYYRKNVKTVVNLQLLSLIFIQTYPYLSWTDIQWGSKVSRPLNNSPDHDIQWHSAGSENTGIRKNQIRWDDLLSRSAVMLLFTIYSLEAACSTNPQLILLEGAIDEMIWEKYSL